MPTVDVLNMNGERVGELELNPVIFDAQINKNLLFDVVKMHLANRRQGTVGTKTEARFRAGKTLATKRDRKSAYGVCVHPSGGEAGYVWA